MLGTRHGRSHAILRAEAKDAMSDLLVVAIIAIGALVGAFGLVGVRVIGG